MPVKIRLMRIGAKKRPFYRVVAVDERKKRTGGYLELLGTYNPLTEPKEVKLDQVKIDAWVKKGAQMSEGFLRVIGKAPQRPPRKPKKEKKEAGEVGSDTSSDVHEPDRVGPDVKSDPELKKQDIPSEQSTIINEEQNP